VSLLICTDGSKGTWNPEVNIKDLITTRKSEQLLAAKELNLSGKVIFLGEVDGELENSTNLRKRVTLIIRNLQPDIVLTHDPWKKYRLHPDHRNVGCLALDALVAARDPLFFPEQNMPPHRPKELLLFEAEDEDHFEQCEGFEKSKIQALLCHQSQFESTMGIGSSDIDSGANSFREVELSKLDYSHIENDLLLAEGFKRISEL
jgi:LmbE family N-acetylglucosaminyl deacetylase